MTLKFFSLMIILTLISVSTLADDTTGSFTEDTDNDAPSYFGWYEGTIVSPLVDVTFDVDVLDIDNSSTELTVDMFYSNDTFAVDNNTINLVYHSLVSANTYKYLYVMTGLPHDTYYKFYYRINDGFTNVEKPVNYYLGTYFDVQWFDAYVPPGGSPKPPTTTLPISETQVGVGIQNIIDQIPFLLLILIPLIGLLIARKKYEDYFN